MTCAVHGMLKSKQLPLRQVGNGEQDHATWTSPERMDPNRPAYKIDASKPGSDAAGETAAAMACGYLAFKTKGWQNIPFVIFNVSINLKHHSAGSSFHVEHHFNGSFVKGSFGP